MPKFEITIECRVPSYRKRATIVVEATSVEDVYDNLDIYSIDDDIELDWEEVMEGHGGFPCDYDIYNVDPVDESVEADIELSDKDEADTN